MKLRSYQQAAVDAVYEYLRTHDDNPCVVIPTGGGKTPVLSTICRDAVQLWGGRVLIITHVKELLEQAVDKLKAVAPDLPVGVYSAGLNRRDTDQPVIAAGIQSIYKRACELDAFDLVVVDEAHMIPPEGDGMYRQFLTDAKRMNPDLRVIGLTATPYRMKSGLICGPDNILNAVCYEVGVRELIRDGYLCPLTAKAGRQKADMSGLHVRGGEFVAGEVEDLMDQDALVEAACAEIVERTRERSACLIFAAGVRHGQHVVRVLTDKHGIECGFVCGDTSDGQRAELLARFRGQSSDDLFACPPLKYLCNVNVLTTGFDAPNVDCVALLRPTMSPGLYYQMCLDMNTEVLTPNGWARCDEIREGDDVGAFDLTTDQIEWCRAEAKVHRPMMPGERMYAIRAPHLDLRVTHLHTMVYRGHSASCRNWRLRTAESLATLRDTYRVPVAGKGDGPGVPITGDELRFLGWALTDGHRNPHNNAIIICQSANSTVLDLSFAHIQRRQALTLFPVVQAGQFVAFQASFAFVVDV